MAEDTTAPTVTEFSFSPTTIDTSASGRGVIATIRIVDNLSGFKRGRLNFVGPTGIARGSQINSRSSREHQLNGVHDVHIAFPRYSKNGVWRVTSISLEDHAGNMRSYSEDELSALGFNTQLTIGESQGEEVFTFTDDFNRANGEPYEDGAPNDWVLPETGLFTGKTPLITSNQLVWTNNQVGMIFRANALLNTRASVKLASHSGDGGTTLGARFIDDLNGYVAAYEFVSSVRAIYKMVGGNWYGNKLSSDLSVTPTANDMIRFTVTGTNPTALLLEVLRSGAVVDSITATDSTAALQVAGRNGVGGEWAAITHDDYSLTELTS